MTPAALSIADLANDLDCYIDKLVQGIETLLSEETITLPLNDDLSYALPALFFLQKRMATLVEKLNSEAD